MSISTYLSIITLNVHELNVPIKRHRVAYWMKKKKDPSICCLQATHFKAKDTHRVKSEGMEKDISCKQKQQESRGSNTK